MGTHDRRYLGQILLDGGFLSKTNLNRAIEEQKRTHELLGQVLVRMGVLKAEEISAPLSVQGFLSSVDDAVKIAAGERLNLGALLVRSKRISAAQLDGAIAEQKRTGEKLGNVFIRLGVLTEQQLAALLEFQHAQEVTTTSTPLRIGELLVATGDISRAQLDDSLCKQSLSHKKLGEVLVEEGYIKSNRIKKGFRLQKMLINAALSALLSLSMAAPGIASTVSLRWDANSETDLAGYKVYYSADPSPFQNAVPIDVSNQTMKDISGLDPAKSYKFAVTSYNTLGAESEFSNVVSIAEQVPPTVSITAPLMSGVVGGIVSISANATDNVGVARVEFYANGQILTATNVPPYIFRWDTTAITNGDYAIVAKAYDSAGNVAQSSQVTVTVDNLAPTLSSSFSLPATSTSLTVAVSGLSATDNRGVTGYLLTESAVAPTAGSAGWSVTPPTSFTFLSAGAKTLYAWAKDSVGNISVSRSSTVNIDVTAPTLNSFSVQSISTSLTVAVSGLSATDNRGVTGYLLTESAVAPTAGSTGWSATAPTSYTFSSVGIKTLYAWAKDSVGNISASKSATVNIDVTAPTLSSSFSLPATSTSLTVAISGLSATDNNGVTGYLLTEGAVTPTAGSAGWSVTAPTSFTFSSEGTKTLYAWAKDSVGNISASRMATVTVTLPVSTLQLMADALLALKIGAGIEPGTPAELARLDVASSKNGAASPDGVVDNGDAMVILRKSIGSSAL